LQKAINKIRQTIYLIQTSILSSIVIELVIYNFNQINKISFLFECQHVQEDAWFQSFLKLIWCFPDLTWSIIVLLFVSISNVYINSNKKCMFLLQCPVFSPRNSYFHFLDQSHEMPLPLLSIQIWPTCLYRFDMPLTVYKTGLWHRVSINNGYTFTFTVECRILQMILHRFRQLPSSYWSDICVSRALVTGWCVFTYLNTL